MTRQDFLSRLSSLNPEDSAGLTALAQDLIKDAREIPSLAVQLCQQGNPDTARKAMITMGEIEEFGIVPLLDAGAQLSVDLALWRLRTVGVNIVHLQRQVVRSIDKQLDDKRKAAAGKGKPQMEEQPPPVRVCDEAYLQMRRLLNVEEGEGQYFMNARAFLSWSDAQKDAEIGKARQSRTWSQMVRSK
jgi:hypothetical protein